MKDRKEYDKRYYEKHKAEIKARVRAYQKANPVKVRRFRNTPQQAIRMKRRADRFHEAIRGIVAYYGCRNPICPARSQGYVTVEMDFHHYESETKVIGVARMTSFSPKRIADEINKCVLLCANCHRRFHAGLISLDRGMLCHVDDDLKVVR